jgi:hypothetical protein
MLWSEALKLLDLGKVIRARGFPVWLYKAYVENVRTVKASPAPLALPSPVAVYVIVGPNATGVLDLAVVSPDGVFSENEWDEVSGVWGIPDAEGGDVNDGT